MYQLSLILLVLLILLLLLLLESAQRYNCFRLNTKRIFLADQIQIQIQFIELVARRLKSKG